MWEGMGKYAPSQAEDASCFKAVVWFHQDEQPSLTCGNQAKAQPPCSMRNSYSQKDPTVLRLFRLSKTLNFVPSVQTLSIPLQAFFNTLPDLLQEPSELQTSWRIFDHLFQSPFKLPSNQSQILSKPLSTPVQASNLFQHMFRHRSEASFTIFQEMCKHFSKPVQT